jgi:hypothetical protein
MLFSITNPKNIILKLIFSPSKHTQKIKAGIKVRQYFYIYRGKCVGFNYRIIYKKNYWIIYLRNQEEVACYQMYVIQFSKLTRGKLGGGDKFSSKITQEAFSSGWAMSRFTPCLNGRLMMKKSDSKKVSS